MKPTANYTNSFMKVYLKV